MPVPSLDQLLAVYAERPRGAGMGLDDLDADEETDPPADFTADNPAAARAMAALRSEVATLRRR